MAPEYNFDDSPTIQPTTDAPVWQPEQDTDDAVDIGLNTLMNCANLLFKARRDKRIGFEPGVTAGMLETMGTLLMRAAHSGKDKRYAIVQHWLATGPDLIEELIQGVAAREKRLLTPGDLTMLLGCCPPDGD